MSIMRRFTLLAVASAATACSAAPDAQEDAAVASAQQAATAPTCITIERGVAGDAADATVSLGGAAKNYGAASSLTASSGSVGQRYGLLRFDLSPIPPGAAISSATARLTVMLYGGAPVAAHRVLAPWSETAVTWNSFGGAFSPTVEATFPATATPSADLTALVQGWVSGSIPNYGIALDQPTDGSTVFASSEFIVSQRPRLDVCYVATTCSDGVQNQGETGVDCGGPCAPCDPCQGVTCTALDACHAVGTCDPTTGVCTNPPTANGTPCDDGNPSTTGDVCSAGVCAGVDRCAGVICQAQDTCHAAGACDPTNGVCSNPALPDGTACSDGSACTTGETCRSGVCSPANEACALCETAPAISFSYADSLLDFNALTADDTHVYLGAASHRIFTVDPVRFSVVRSVQAPLGGNFSVAYARSLDRFFYASVYGQNGPNFADRLLLSGAVELGPVTLPGVVNGAAWDDPAGELHLITTQGVVVTDASFNIKSTYAGYLSAPVGIAINPRIGRVAITEGHWIYINRSSDHVNVIQMGPTANAFGVSLTDGSHVWVSDRTSGTVVGADFQGNMLQTFSGLLEPRSVLFHQATGCLFVSEQGGYAPGAVSRLRRFCPC